MAETIGILTAGGDSPGLNAAIRGVGKAAIRCHQMHLLGFRDGFRGLIENRMQRLTSDELSGILTIGGTILGTSRDKPHKMQIGNKTMDMTEVVIDSYNKLHLDALVCIGGGGTQKNAYRLQQHGLNILTLPKTIDNDVVGTDVTFGFDTALGIATEAIDRLHSTAHSHHRIIVVEVMGHNAGWLALGAGIAGGADVILIPEIPYDVEAIAESIRHRSRTGSRFSIVAVSEGAMSVSQAEEYQQALAGLEKTKSSNGSDDAKNDKVEKSDKAEKNDKMEKNDKPDTKKRDAKQRLADIEAALANSTLTLSSQLEELTRLESRVTILGHVQRGGTPSAADRILATRLGTACVSLIKEGASGVMVASKGESAVPVPLADIVGRRKTVPPDHDWIKAARDIGVCMGNS